ncbi:FadR/GntR family transcriptional regulator [Acerihabitans sp.]|uniref:FadR/GntR family transcriptional regulator n=1 Tax=Acerihabitans sp. TaxID=2811394 RepID=UPI002ED8E23A
MNKEEKTDWITPIPKQSVSRMVLEKIKDAMIRKELKPGDFLPSENELVTKMGVGKSSAREAIKMLEAMGVIEIIKGQGCRIKNTFDSDVLQSMIFQMILQQNTDEDLVELRLLFEISASKLAAENATEDDFQLLEKSIEKTEKDYARGIHTPDNDINFHNLIFKSTHNPYLMLIGATIMELFRGSLTVVNVTQCEAILEQHRMTLKALRDKDMKAIENAVRSTVDKWKEHSLEHH